MSRRRSSSSCPRSPQHRSSSPHAAVTTTMTMRSRKGRREEDVGRHGARRRRPPGTDGPRPPRPPRAPSPRPPRARPRPPTLPGAENVGVEGGSGCGIPHGPYEDRASPAGEVRVAWNDPLLSFNSDHQPRQRGRQHQPAVPDGPRQRRRLHLLRRRPQPHQQRPVRHVHDRVARPADVTYRSTRASRGPTACRSTPPTCCCTWAAPERRLQRRRHGRHRHRRHRQGRRRRRRDRRRPRRRRHPSVDEAAYRGVRPRDRRAARRLHLQGVRPASTFDAASESLQLDHADAGDLRGRPGRSPRRGTRSTSTTS